MRDFDRRSLIIGSGTLLAGLAINLSFAADSSVSEIKRRGVLVAGTEAAFEPYEFLKDGEIVGFGHDLLLKTVDRLGVKLEQLNLPFQGLLPGLLAKKFDIVATSVGINPERAKRFAYTRPVGGVAVDLVVRYDDKTINSLDDLAGKVVGTQLGSAIQPLAVASEKKLKEKGGTGFAELKLFQTYEDSAVAMTNKQVDAVFIASNIADYLMNAQPSTLRIVSQADQTRYVCWVVRPDQLSLREYVNETIAELIANGKLAEMQKKWFGRTMDIPSSGYLPPGAI